MGDPDGHRTRTRLLAAGILGLWAVIAGLAAPATLRLASVETNDFSSLLPAGAPSTLALHLLHRVEGANRNEALVVWRAARPEEHLDAVVAPAEAAIEHARINGVISIGPIETAPDHLVAIAPVVTNGAEAGTLAAVARLRSTVSATAPPGISAGVTGPAAFETDLLGSLAGVDTKLLVVTALLVTALLIANYRSPVAWVLPLIAVAAAELLANAATYLVARVSPVNGESTGLLTVLVFGIGTDYALLLTSRYREELGRHPDDLHALAVAYRRAAPAIIASATTVTAGLACLLLADDGVTHGFALVGMLGVAATAAAMLSAYPALLALTGRRIFWPLVPDGNGTKPGHSFWGAVGRSVGRHPRIVWMGGIALLITMGAGLSRLDTHMTTVSDLPPSAPSVKGMELLAGSLPEGITAPAFVTVTKPASATRARQVASSTPGVFYTSGIARRGAIATFDVVFRAAPVGQSGLAPVRLLQNRLAAADGHSALVGGQTAQDLDTARASRRDLFVVGPVVLAVTVIVLGLLLRALAGPLLVAATVVVSYGAILGAVAALSGPVLHWPGIDPSVPVLSFVFLVSLGIDYNIFLMARTREELARDPGSGIERAVAATGGVLTAAGLILAGTFSALLVLPLIPTKEIGLVVAVGVLLDALFVRSVVLPALVVDTGHGFWWPTRLSGAVTARRHRKE